MSVDTWDGRLRRLQGAYGSVCDSVTYQKHSPAEEQDVLDLEEKWGISLPQSLRAALLQFSSDVLFEADFTQAAPEMPMSYELRKGLFRARLAFSLRGIGEAEKERRDLADNVFTQNTAADRFWQNKLAVMLVPGGDVIALDLAADETEPPVVYLSYHEKESHGLRLGDNFADFIDRYIEIGAVGPEDTQLELFMDEWGEASGIQKEGENAYLFRGALGVEW